MVKPFRLTYLAGGGGGEGVYTPPILEILTIVCLTFRLLLAADRSILGLPEFELKDVNICKMDKTWSLEVVVL